MARNDLTVEQLLEEIKGLLEEIKEQNETIIGHLEADESELEELGKDNK